MLKGYYEAFKAQINLLFENCDKLEYLSYRNIQDNITKIEDMIIPALKPFKESFVSVEKGASWGMEGLIFTFKPTQSIRDFFINNITNNDVSYGGFLYVNEDKTKLLENPAYIKNDTLQYSCCSHEDYMEGDKKFLAELERVYIQGMKKDEVYQIILDKAEAMPSEIYNNKKKLLQIFHDIENYIAEERKDFIFCCPRYKCSFSEFKKATKILLTDDIVNEFQKCKNYIDVASILPQIGEKYFAELYYWSIVKIFKKQ